MTHAPDYTRWQRFLTRGVKECYWVGLILLWRRSLTAVS